jgi:hypothetical protein
MADEYKAGQLIIREIGMLNEAITLLENTIQPSLLKAVTACMESFANKNNFLGKFDIDDKNSGMGPASWNIGENNEAFNLKAWFFIYPVNSTGNDYWITLLTNQGKEESEAGIMLRTDPATYGRKKAWNTFFSNIDAIKLDNMKKIGFKVIEDDENRSAFFLPIILDSEKLAETWGENGEFTPTDECFAPVQEALQKSKEACLIFDEILSTYPEKS